MFDRQTVLTLTTSVVLGAGLAIFCASPSAAQCHTLPLMECRACCMQERKECAQEHNVTIWDPPCNYACVCRH
jgi:hypothetical protein